jgi:hypothetical protein
MGQSDLFAFMIYTIMVLVFQWKKYRWLVEESLEAQQQLHSKNK